MEDTLLEVKDLKLHFFTDEGVVQAVDGVDLTLHRGRTLCLVGESGCGKSVTSRAFLQIVHPPGRIVGGQMLFSRRLPAGRAEWVDLARLDPRGRTIREIRGGEIAMIFQEPMTSLSLMHTIGDQLTEAIRLHTPLTALDARRRAIDALRQVEIPRPDRLIDEYPFRLSGGMRQRVMIAMALSCNPSILIADEPTTALDVTTQAQILDLMRKIQRERDMAILFITHDLGVVAEIADDVAVMYLGRIVEQGPVDAIFNAAQHPYTQALLRSIPKISLAREALDPIQGMVPSPFRRPTGCTFHPRCSRAVDDCRRIQPSLTTVSENHHAACLLVAADANRESLRPAE